eukprot:3446564-Prymnesium_polylepis.1
MSRTATWRQPVHSTCVLTVNRNGWAVCLRTKYKRCALASSTRLVRSRHSIAECAREEIVPWETCLNVSTNGPAS